MPQRYFPVIISSLVLALTHVSYAQALTPTGVTTAPTVSKDFRIGPTLKQASENRPKTDKSRQENVKDYLEQKKQLHEQKRESLETKLKTFKDLRRKEVVLKLDEKIASISSKRAERMSEALDKLEDILTRIQTNSDGITGCDKTDLNSAIAFAENSLALASVVVDSQAVKSYEFNISAEDSAKTNVGTTIKLVTQDLRNTHQEVIKAKQAVLKAATELRRLKSCVKKTGTPISSPSAQPTAFVATPSVTLSPTSTVEQ